MIYSSMRAIRAVRFAQSSVLLFAKLRTLESENGDGRGHPTAVYVRVSLYVSERGWGTEAVSRTRCFRISRFAFFR